MSTPLSVEGPSGQRAVVGVSGPDGKTTLQHFSLSLFNLMKGVDGTRMQLHHICFGSGLSCCQGRAIKNINYIPKNGTLITSAVLVQADASVSNQGGPKGRLENCNLA